MTIGQQGDEKPLQQLGLAEDLFFELSGQGPETLLYAIHDSNNPCSADGSIRVEEERTGPDGPDAGQQGVEKQEIGFLGKARGF